MSSPDGRGPRLAVFLGLSLVAGVGAMVLIVQLLAGYQARLDAARLPEPTVLAIVATRDLYQGIPIGEEDIYAVEVPADLVHEGVYTSPDHVLGRIPRERILANEYVREERLADASRGRGLNALVPRGMRAISIDLDGGAAVSGFLNPGNHVDVVVTLADGDGVERGGETHTVVQAVGVLAVNDRLSDGDEPSESGPTRRTRPSVTLAVTPVEA